MSNFTTENLIPYTGTIQPGQRLIKRKDGTFLPVGVAGAGTGTGSSMDFYKCTYVSSDSSLTWKGRKAVLQEGVYIYESDSTSGLLYGAVKPSVDNTYSADALIQAVLYQGSQPGIPQNGLIFYASMDGTSPNQAQTGQAIQTVGGDYPQLTTVDGIPCLSAGQSSARLTSSISNLPSGKSPIAVSIWLKANNENIDGFGIYLGTQESQTNGYFSLGRYYGGVFAYWAFSSAQTTAVTIGSWRHILAMHDGQTLYVYADGQLISSSALSQSFNFQNTVLAIGGKYQSWGANFRGYVSAVRIYNRVLSQNQIAALAAEFTPAS